MTSNHHAPYVLGYTRATMAVTKSCELVRVSESQKGSLSSDWLVIPNQHVGVNAFPGLVHTARHAMGVGNTQSRCTNRKEGPA